MNLLAMWVFIGKQICHLHHGKEDSLSDWSEVRKNYYEKNYKNFELITKNYKLCEVELILNNRPITHYYSEDAENVLPPSYLEENQIYLIQNLKAFQPH